MSVAIVNFRTLANGSYKYMAGKRRGYWRVLVVRDINGPLMSTSRNVISIPYESCPGIDGVTERSSYHLGASLAHCRALAVQINSQRIAGALVSHHMPEGL